MSDAEASPKAKEVFATISGGDPTKLPNAIRALANSDPVVKAYGALSAELSGTLDPEFNEIIGLAVGSRNSSSYCAALHSGGATACGIKPAAIAAAKTGASADPRIQVALKYVEALIDTQGNVSEEQFAEVHKTFSAKEVIEITAQVGFNLAFNLFNKAYRTPHD
jgi:alkylhydroperoxidase family enzyme